MIVADSPIGRNGFALPPTAQDQAESKAEALPGMPLDEAAAVPVDAGTLATRTNRDEEIRQKLDSIESGWEASRLEAFVNDYLDRLALALKQAKVAALLPLGSDPGPARTLSGSALGRVQIC